jgi:hypothetical protein
LTDLPGRHTFVSPSPPVWPFRGPTGDPLPEVRMRSSHRRGAAAALPLLVLVTAMLALTSCAEQNPSDPLAPDGDASLIVVSGDAQSGAAGEELSAPLVVKVVGKNGTPRPHEIVNFRVVTGAGSVYAGSSITDAHGIAQEYWTLGSTPGPNTLEVRAVDPTTGEKRTYATFTASGVVGAIARIDVTPASRTLETGETVQLSATAQDRFGNAVVGRPFAWSSADATIADVSTSGLVTAGNGGGPIAVTASAEGASGAAQITVLQTYAPDPFEPNFGFNPTLIGTLNDGSTISVFGTLHNLTDEDWYTVRANAVSPAGCTAGDQTGFTLTVKLNDIPAGRVYALELRTGGPGTALVQQTSGSANQTITHTVTATCGTPSAADILLRVRRVSGDPSGTSYSLVTSFSKN